MNRLLANARDLGGLPAAGGRIRPGVLYRSDAPYAGDAPPPLDPWPPALVVDLRSSGESADGHPLAAPGTVIVSLPLLAAANPVQMATESSADKFDLASIYREIVATGADSLVRIARLVSETDGAVLVHCSAGKDRTGVAVALLLLAAGVPRAEVVADYSRTEPNMEGVAARLATAWGADEEGLALVRKLVEDRPDLLEAPAFTIEGVIDAVGGEAGAAEWFGQNGLRPEELERLRARLVEQRR